MNRDDRSNRGFRLKADCPAGSIIHSAFCFQILAQFFRIHCIGLFINVNKVDESASLRNSLRRRNKSIWDSDDNFPCLHPRSNQGEPQGIGTISNSNTIFCTTKMSKLSFKVFHSWTTDKPRRSQRLSKRRYNFLLECRMRRDEVYKGDIVTHYLILLSTRAGFPETMVLGGTFFVTTLPAPTKAFSPIVMLPRIVAPDPMVAPFFMSVGSTFQSFSVCNPPSRFVARGYLSLINVTPDRKS